MQTFQEQRDFFNQHWDAMKAVVENDGVDGIVKFIDGFTDDLERRVLYVFARQGVMFQDWQGKNFDTYIGICDAGVKEILRQVESADDDEDLKKKLRSAHVLCYNLSADLADCWPGDETPRSKSHYERGLKAAEDCLKWADRMGSDANTYSIDFWAKGIHELSLGYSSNALESWSKSLEYACRTAELDPVPAMPDPAQNFGVILGFGYVGLAEWICGNDIAKSKYHDAISAFKNQFDDAEKKSDAEFGISQLEKVRQKYLS